MADIMLGQLLHRPTIDPISGDSPLPVQLSGSLVSSGITALPRAVVTSPQSTSTLVAPANVRGVLITLKVYAATGTFGADQGATMYAILRTADGYSVAQSASVTELTAAGARYILVYPGCAACTGLMSPNNIIRINSPLAGGFLVNSSITGTFGAGEGVDREVTYQWLY
jgi:hypothetical protein